jgi:hypothetical protein
MEFNLGVPSLNFGLQTGCPVFGYHGVPSSLHANTSYQTTEVSFHAIYNSLFTIKLPLEGQVMYPAEEMLKYST